MPVKTCAKHASCIEFKFRNDIKPLQKPNQIKPHGPRQIPKIFPKHKSSRNQIPLGPQKFLLPKVSVPCRKRAGETKHEQREDQNPR